MACRCGQPAIQATIEDDGTTGEACVKCAGIRQKQTRTGDCERCHERAGIRTYPVGEGFVRVCDTCWSVLRGRSFYRNPAAMPRPA